MITTIYTYMHPSEVESRVRGQVYRQWRSILGFHMSISDVIQEVHLALLQRPYNPEKYTKELFVTMNIRSELGHINRHLRTHKMKPLRYNTVYESEDEQTYEIDMQSDGVDPLELMLANEMMAKVKEQNIRNAVIWGEKLNQDLI